MRVTIPLAFNVEVVDGMADDDELTIEQAKDAAIMAAFDYLILTNNGVNNVDSVEIHVDGFGLCRVTIEEDR